MDVITLLIAVATMWNWYLKHEGINIKEFGKCSTEWKHVTLMRAGNIILYN